MSIIDHLGVTENGPDPTLNGRASSIAHVRADQDSEFILHELADHLLGTGDKAQRFGDRFGHGDWAALAGRWHDLGKYRPAFQSYIRSASGYDAHIETAPGRVDHSTAGAIHALNVFEDAPPGRILAYCIAGHHAGLPDWYGAASSLSQRRTQTDYLKEALSAGAPEHLLAADAETRPKPGCDAAMWTRMLFSCLVDADFLDTEAFMSPARGALRAQDWPTLASLKERLDGFLAELQNTVVRSAVNDTRQQILADCRAAAHQPPGAFTLTAPTGSGKTLASLAFALDHAALHGLDRIIYAIPYTSIIEQTADVFRGVLGADSVLEHHSQLDAERETPRSRIAAENWDATLIVTTTLQLFESLYAARPSRCRKLHRLARSVIIIDEAQLLPPACLNPILKSIQQLTDIYQASVVLTTATQPALTQEAGPPKELQALVGSREISSDVIVAHQALRRVRVELPEDLGAKREWIDIAEEASRFEQVLIVVSARQDARDLHALMPADTFYLSTWLCGAHRSAFVAAIRRRLTAGEPCRVVSTQLIEAGVDVDFPVVYRAMAGLDSLSQSAGRCNREGHLDEGVFRVFVPPTASPPGHLKQARQSAERLLASAPADPFAPKEFQRFFADLYWKKGAEGLDAHDVLSCLVPNRDATFQFRTAAERFRMIEDNQASVVVAYGEGHHLIDTLKQSPDTVDRRLLRQLQRYTVSASERRVDGLRGLGLIEKTDGGYLVQTDEALYDEALGMRVELAS